MRLAELKKLNDLRAAGRAAVAMLDPVSGIVDVFAGDEPIEGLERQAKEALRRDRPVEAGLDDKTVTLLPYNPPLRLFVVGAVHIAQALAPIAERTGYRVTIIDPRGAFADALRFPDVEVDTRWPDEALDEAVLDRRTAVVTLTHDPKLDDPALEAALKAPVFYVAALGSKKTHAARVERLRRAGFDDADIARIHGPAGLAIGAATPAEIAVSILAEMTARLRAGQAAS